MVIINILHRQNVLFGQLFGMLPVVLLLYSCINKKQTIHAQHKSITQSVYASGIIKSRNQYQVFAGTPGLIAKLYISEGDLVKEGQVLLKINNKALRLNRENASLAAGYNSFQNNEDKLQELQRNINAAQLKSETDSAIYTRQLNLWQQNIGSRVELEQKALNAQNSKMNYESAVLRYEQLQKQLSFAAKQSKTNLDISSLQANDLDVKSEIAGKVFSVLKKQGEMVTAQTPLAIIGDSTDFYLELQVDEYDISQIKEGQRIVVTMDSYRDRSFDAVVSKIYPIMNEQTRSFTIEADFISKPEHLYPNLTVEANIIITTKDRALLIPRSYITDDNNVWLKNGTKRKVVTGLKDYEQVEILDGITESDDLIKPEQ